MIAPLFALALTVANGAAPPPPRQNAVPGSGLTVYLVTFGSGPRVWERFGHNALWIHDSVAGTDQAYDYGRFSFESERFFLRFARGDLLYWMGQGEVRAYLQAYQRAGRSIWIQELDLPPAARIALRDFLRWNVREENKYYQYDYYLDNCSTRIRDAIDRVVGGQLKRWAEGVRTELSYRDHTRRLTENSVAIRTALDLGLGQPVDRKLSAWEEMFLPISLRPHLNRATVRDPDGRIHPLVRREEQVFASDRYPIPSTPADWIWRYLVAGGILGLAAAFVGRAAGGSSRARWVFGVSATTWSFVCGIAGGVLAGLWAFTNHRFSVDNENLFQLNLISLGLAFVLPGALWGSAGRRRVGLVLAGLVAAVGTLGVLLKVSPAVHQANLGMVALILPVHLGVLAGLLAAGPKPAWPERNDRTPGPRVSRPGAAAGLPGPPRNREPTLPC